MKETNFKLEDITDKKIELMRKYLEGNPEYFCKETSATSLHDAVFFRMRSVENMMYVGDLFLVDIYGNELWICELLSKPVYNKIRKEKLNLKPIVLVVKDCQEKFYRFNGYWVIPVVGD